MAAQVTIQTRLLAAALAFLSAPVAYAQNSPAAQPLPGLDQFNLPSSRPTPQRTPDPEPTVNPRPLASPVAPPPVIPTVRATPEPRATPAATPRRNSAPVPVPTVTPSPLATPTSAPTPIVSPSPQAVTPTPAASPAAPVAAATGDGAGFWGGFAVGAAVLLVAAGGFLWWRRRKPIAADLREPAMPEAVAEVPPIISPPPEPAPPPPPQMLAPLPAPVSTDRATLELELIPNRAGTDPRGAVVDYLIVVRNTGKAAASAIRLDVRLLGAGAQQDAVIAVLFGGPIAKPITPPFDLIPGATIELGGSAMHPRETLEVMHVADKTLFVPVLAVNVLYDWSGGHGQTAQSYVIGIARGAEAKLQPFRLDAPPRLYESVSAIDYTVSAIH